MIWVALQEGTSPGAVEDSIVEDEDLVIVQIPLSWFASRADEYTRPHMALSRGQQVIHKMFRRYERRTRVARSW